MGTRLDDLENSIGDLMTQAGIEEDLPSNTKAITSANTNVTETTDVEITDVSYQ